MLKVGITGVSGFLGKNLSKAIDLYSDLLERVHFDKSFFYNNELLHQFVLKCDVIVHLASLSRHPKPGFVYDNNIYLAKRLVESMTFQNTKPYLISASSIHDQNDTEYGKCKRDEYKLFSEWSNMYNSKYTCLVLSNIYGPHCKPNYASFIATFCYKLTNNEEPSILTDSVIKLTYVDNLTRFIINKIFDNSFTENVINEYVKIPWDIEVKVSDVLYILKKFKKEYFDRGKIPIFSNDFERNLYITFQNYISLNASIDDI
jgi:UDP-2-acetamido-2,6-beta-L-arabino-hexul-4-ose reductase